MDKLIVDIGKIRGLGNIVSQKSFSDFRGYQSIISESEETVELTDSKVFSIIPLSSLKVNTFLTINIPLNLVYSDEFNITGTLRDIENNPVSNVNVKLKVGDTIVDTQTTNSDGVVSFTQTPVVMGTHSFQLIFDGNTEYNNSASSIIIREIRKETSVLNITSPMNNQVFYTSDSIVCNGSLLTDDGEALANKIITLFVDGDEFDTTVGVDGSFSKTLNLNAGQYSLYADYAGNEYYTPSDLWVDFAVLNESLSLAKTDGKQILSYHNVSSGDEYCTITATLHASDNIDKPITFKQGNNVLAVVNTNNNGKASYTYQSTGAGDVIITAECMNLSETFSLVDALYYDATEQTFNSTVSGGDHSTVIDSSVAITLPSACEISFKFKSTSSGARLSLGKNTSVTVNPEYALYAQRDSNYFMGYRSTSTTSVVNIPYDNDYHEFKFIKNGAEIKFYIDGVLHSIQNLTWIDDYIYTWIWSYWRSGTIYVKDRLIKVI